MYEINISIFLFDSPEHVFMRDWIGERIENILSTCLRSYSIQELRRVLPLSVRSCCWISVESVMSSCPTFVRAGASCCHDAHCYFRSLWTSLGDAHVDIVSLLWHVVSVLCPKTQNGKNSLRVAQGNANTCSVVLREIYRLHFFFTYLLLSGLVMVHMDWSKGCSFLWKLCKEAAVKS